MTSFDGLGLAEPLQRALKSENYTKPTPIQAEAIPLLIEGRDLLGIAQTGTGKTAAFALPLLHRLAATRPARVPRSPRALILAPTRELARQIDERARAYGRALSIRTAVIFGGVGQGLQVKALREGVDILIATPGRLIDLLNQNHVRLDKVEILVLDEADRMLDMGFIRDVRKIVAKCPKERQTLLFSATMPRDIAKLAGDILHNPARVEVTPETIAVDRIEQGVYFVPAQQKRTLLTQLLKDSAMDRVLVFTRTKHGADKVCRYLSQAGESVEALHGNKAQNARVRALDAFKSGRARILVATDIAARGIDVQNISHVINYEMPNEPESYVHRIGRTARAGKGGAALSFCDGSERAYLRSIERLIRREIEVLAHDLPKVEPEAEQAPANGHSRNGAPKRGRPSRGRPGQANHRANGSRPHAQGQKSTHRNASRSGAQH